MSEGIIIDGGTWYVIYAKPQGVCIKCYHCGMISYNKNDVKNKYCGNCNVFIGDDK
jgi:hypothetical protein